MARTREAALLREDGRTVCERCTVADSPWSRMRGLLGRRDLPRDEGLLIEPTWSVHMFFMRFAIDVVFLDCDGVVLRIAERLGPWRMASHRGARSVLELAAGEAGRRGLRVGDRLDVVGLAGTGR